MWSAYYSSLGLRFNIELVRCHSRALTSLQLLTPLLSGNKYIYTLLHGFNIHCYFEILSVKRIHEKNILPDRIDSPAVASHRTLDPPSSFYHLMLSWSSLTGRWCIMSLYGRNQKKSTQILNLISIENDTLWQLFVVLGMSWDSYMIV